MSEFVCIVFVLLSILGLVTTVKEISMRILRFSEGETIIILPFEGHCESVEYRIRCAVERAHWCGGSFRVICLDKGMDEETRAVCLRVCERFGAEIRKPSIKNE